MYLPAHFEEKRLEVLHEAMRRPRLATLVTFGPEGLDATHLPLLLDAAPGALGTLVGHLARANPQWRAAPAELPALAIFLGPDAYVTPSWYPTKRETGAVVPTWNYLAVHAHGKVCFFEEPERLLALVTRLTERHEASRPEPWAVSDAPRDYLAKMLGAIVGFELVIERLEGKWKMSQNRTEAERAGVVEGLEREHGPAEVAALVRERGRR